MIARLSRSEATLAAAISRMSRGRISPCLAWYVLACLVSLAIVAAFRWHERGEFPTGLDAGSWLGFGRSWFGDGHKADNASYPPLVPTGLHILSFAFNPLGAAKLGALGSVLALVIAFFVVCRALRVDGLVAAAGGLLLGLNGVIGEVATFGGYPQHVATAFLLAGLPTVARTLTARPGAAPYWAGASLGAVALTHHATFPIAVACWGLLWLSWISTSPGRAAAIVRTRRLAAAAAPGVLFFGLFYFQLRQLGFEPTLGTGQGGIDEALRLGLRDAPWLWRAVGVVALLSLVATARRQRKTARWQVATAMLGGPLLLLLLTAEQRVVPAVVVGAVLAATIGLDALRPKLRPNTRLAPFVLAMAAVVILWPNALDWAGKFRTYYTVVDGDLVETIQWVDRNHDDGRIAVRHVRDGWAVGWWYEGMSDARVLSGSDPQWLAFPEEKRNATIAAAFFAPGLSRSDALALAVRTNVSFLAFSRFEWHGWLGWVAADVLSPRVAFENQEYVVLDMRPAPQR